MRLLNLECDNIGTYQKFTPCNILASFIERLLFRKVYNTVTLETICARQKVQHLLIYHV